MKVYLAEEVRESIATRMLPLEDIEKDFDFAVDMMLHGASAFEIVQCKDCKHRSDGGWCDVYIQPRMDTDYCNHGERLCNHDWRKGGDDE